MFTLCTEADGWAGKLIISTDLSIRHSFSSAFFLPSHIFHSQTVIVTDSLPTVPIMSESSNATQHLHAGDIPKVETATIEDLDQLTELVMELFELQSDFTPNRTTQERGLQLILEQPNRGRIFILRNDHQIIGMVNLLFTLSSAEGGMVMLLEDFIIHPTHRGHGYGTLLVKHVKQFAKNKNFTRITLLTDKISSESQKFFQTQGFCYSSMIPMRLSNFD